ncbi:ead/Ea22-like family protein [Klebsiella pneumoniae]
MTTDITELAQRMKAAAEKATPGEWVYFPKNTSIEYDVGSDESQGSILYVDSGDFTQAQTDRNGEFIALANPANILALVEALEKAQETIAFQQGEIKALLSSLESRTVKLPDLRQIVSGDRYVWSDGVYNYSQDVKVVLADAGIKVEAE